VPRPWNVAFNNGRALGDVLRTTVGSNGGRKMAFDILCMPNARADLVFCPGDVGLTCSAAAGCSEAVEVSEVIRAPSVS
jgi:hypothetical protein